jgi:type II secretory pathway pseudopilin PulG
MQTGAQQFNSANRLPSRGERAFTMVEIALSLAVVAFALVAIIGVLPLGMTVQKDNREDTLIGQEGRFWLEAIKSGARGIYDLTNYVEFIRVQPTNVGGTTPFQLVEVENNAEPYLTPTEIIGLLSIPKYEGPTNRVVTNIITARVRAITGPATEQSPFTNSNPNVFRYELQTEITKYRPVPPELIRQAERDNPTNGVPMRQVNETIGGNLWDVRLVLRWPVVERGNGWFVGNNRKVFRAQVAGVPQSFTNFNRTLILDRDELYLFTPNHFNVANFEQLP